MPSRLPLYLRMSWLLMRFPASSRIALLALCLLTADGAVSARGAPDSFAPLVRRVLPTVVNIAVTENATTRATGRDLPRELRDTPLGREFLRRFGERQQRTTGAGSGFIIDPGGIIVTNNHVVGNAEQIIVSLSNGRRYPATLIGQDTLTDIAVIRVTAAEPLPAATWGDSRKAQVGDWVLAAGNPFGLGGSVTAGIISAEGRDLGSGPFDNFLQLDAPINPGNSGGPVFNMDGQVIGVSSVILSPTGASVGIGFAIPSETVSQVVRQLLAGKGAIQRGWLGVSVEDRTTGDRTTGAGDTRAGDTGVLITGIDRNGPAARAGIRPGDEVVSINGEPVASSRGLIRAVAVVPPGNNARLGVRRRGRMMEIPVAVGLRPMATAGDEPAGPDE